MKERVRHITRRTGRTEHRTSRAELRSICVGWKNYFRLADTPGIFAELDEWIRHRLRALHLKHWKRGTTIFRELRRGASPSARPRRWRATDAAGGETRAMLINIAFPNRYFDQLDVPRLAA